MLQNGAAGGEAGLLPLRRAASLAVPNLGIGVLEIALPCAWHGLRLARRSSRYSGWPSVRAVRRQGDSLSVTTPSPEMKLGGQTKLPQVSALTRQSSTAV